MLNCSQPTHPTSPSLGGFLLIHSLLPSAVEVNCICSYELGALLLCYMEIGKGMETLFFSLADTGDGLH